MVNPGESIAFTTQNVPVAAGRSDRLQATTWQLPLLMLRNQDDPELLQQLTQLLARIGHTKVRHLYEEQIRQLGPAGTLPLIAFVRSAESKGKNELRQNAMKIIADLAPLSSMKDLESLLNDSDTVVRRRALTALHRLQPNRKFESP